jgi:hypothetical protein
MTTPASSSSAPALAVRCPVCGAAASGRFCAECGAPVNGAICVACRAPLTAGARFCHRCGNAVGNVPPRPSGIANALPWTVAAIALVSLIALLAGQRFGRAREATADASVSTVPAGGVRAPDISTMSPDERAERLYDRIMSAAERGLTDSVQFFMPMALQAYESLAPLNVDQRYDLGRLAEVAGDPQLAAAEADSILRTQPDHLLGLVLASRAARMRGDAAASRRYLARLARVERAEKAKQLPEYLLHQNDIDVALGRRAPVQSLEPRTR